MVGDEILVPRDLNADQIIGQVTIGRRARIGASAVVTEDVPEGATMIGLKARSTLVKAETWAKEFMPYGTPCKEPCEPTGGGHPADSVATTGTADAD